MKERQLMKNVRSLNPIYPILLQQEFGEMPKYLVQRKRDLENSDELYRKSLVERQLIKMSNEERKDLLEVRVCFTNPNLN